MSAEEVLGKEPYTATLLSVWTVFGLWGGAGSSFSMKILKMDPDNLKAAAESRFVRQHCALW